MSELIESATVDDLTAGALVIREGESDDRLFVVVEGEVSVVKSGPQDNIEVTRMERAALFGIISVLTLQPRTISVVTSIDSKLIEIPGATVRKLADAAPKFGKRLAVLMAKRIQDIDAAG